jgi:hypothetical protein
MDVFALALRISETGSNAALNAMERLEHQGHKTSEAVDKVGERLEFIAVAAAAVTAAFSFEKIVEATAAAQSAQVELQGAVENAGASWKAWSPILDEVAEQMLGRTRFGVDETRKALGNLITITGNVRTAFADISLAADIAAKKHMGFEEAATLVGRVAEGNTGMLVRYGIVLRDGGDAMEELRKKFGGFAEREGATLGGTLERSKNLLEELSKTFGEAVIGTDVMTGATQGFNKVILTGIEWIKANKLELHAIADVLGAIGSRIAKGAEVALSNLWQAFKEGQAFIVALVANVDMIPDRFKRALGATLMSLGDFLAQEGDIVDRLFGTNFEGRADKIANAGSRMMIEANRQLGFLGTAARTTIDEIMATSEAAESASKKAEGLPGGGTGAPTGPTAQQIEEQKKLVAAFKDLHDLHALTDADTRAGLVLEGQLNAELHGGNVARERRAEILKELHSLQESGVAIGTFDVVDIREQALTLQDTLKDIHPVIEPKVVFAMDAADVFQTDAWEALTQQFDELGPHLSEAIADTLGKAFSTGFQGAGREALKALGSIFSQMGHAMLLAGVAFFKLLPVIHNPLSPGAAFALLAAGAILTALGAGLSGAMSGGGGSGGGYGGGYAGGYGSGGGYDDYTRVTLNGTTARNASAVTPIAPQTNHITVIGPDDPTAQRQLVSLLKNAVGRGFSVPGMAG